MTRDDVIRLALHAGFSDDQANVYFDRQLERFAALIAAQEREACAQLCEDYQDAVDRHKWPDGYTLAGVIREKE